MENPEPEEQEQSESQPARVEGIEILMNKPPKGSTRGLNPRGLRGLKSKRWNRGGYEASVSTREG